MTDRELLELAAKAAGYGRLVWWEEMQVYQLADQCPIRVFNSLSFKGDALQLCADLNIEFSLFDNEKRVNAGVWGIDSKPWDCMTPYGDNKALAICRAITRAAAEIGRAMP